MNWGALIAISIDGVDRTADCLGSGSVDAELDAAAIAEFRLRGAMPSAGDDVVISGIVAQTFVGEVDRVQYDPDPDQRCWVIRATDGLQSYFDGLGVAAVRDGFHISSYVVAALPDGAYWHEALFSQASDGWEACQDAMQCAAASIWMSGGSLSYASWAPQTPATTISHPDGGIYDGSIRLDQAGLRDLVAEVVLDIEINYTRLHQWVHVFSWGGPGLTFCENYSNQVVFPSRNVIADAVQGNTWALMASGSLSGGGSGGVPGIRCEGLWPSGGYDCGSGPIVWILNGGAEDYVRSASWRMGRRWAQTMVERYRFTLTGTDAIGLPETDGFGYEFPGDDGWDTSPPNTAVPEFAQSADGWITVSSNQTGGQHRHVDLWDPAVRDDLLAAAWRLAAVRIRRTQRRNTLTATVLPGLEPGLGSWAEIAADGVDGVGQVARQRTWWDFGAHGAGCDVSLALSDGSMDDDDLSAPAGPDMTPAAAGYTLGLATELETHIGGVTGAPEQDDEWTGWIGNRAAPDSGAIVYSMGFTVQTPDVPDLAREDQSAIVIDARVVDPLDGSLAIT